MVPGFRKCLTVRLKRNSLMSIGRKVTDLISLLDRALTWIALICGGATLAFMTLFSVLNVLIMRKALNNPIVGAEDLLLLALVAIVALSIPFGARSGAHIEIEVLEEYMSAGFAKWSMICVKIVCMVLLGIMASRLWYAGQMADSFGETTQQLLISFEYFYYMLSISIAIYVVVLLLDIWQLLTTNKVISLKFEGEVL